MKRNLLLTGLVLGLMLCNRAASAADTTADDQAFFDKQISKLVHLHVKLVKSTALDKVFTGSFFNLEIVVSDSTNSLLVARQGDDIIQITLPNTTADMPDLLKLINPDFKLASDENGHALQDAVDVLYPIDTTFNKDDLAAKTIRHEGNKYTLIRGKFFDHFKGFIFTTDGSGKVTAVSYSLDIK